MAEGRVLLIGYGNPGRQDDGLGPAAAEAIERLGLPGVRAQTNYQLTIEDSAEAAQHDWVVFVDAAREGPEPFSLERVAPRETTSCFASHAVKPELVLGICREVFGRAPGAYLLGIRGYAFEFREELTERARANLDRAAARLRSLLESLAAA